MRSFGCCVGKQECVGVRSYIQTSLRSVTGPKLGWPANATAQLCSLLSTSTETGTNSAKLVREFLREALRQPQAS